MIETSPRGRPGARLAAIHARVGELLDEHAPAALAVEDLYFGTNARSAFAVGQARGVVMLAAGQRGVPCFSYTPQQVKGAVCGIGPGRQGAGQRMVQALLSLAELPGPTTRRTRSPSPSATPTARRCARRGRAAA